MDLVLFNRPTTTTKVTTTTAAAAATLFGISVWFNWSYGTTFHVN